MSKKASVNYRWTISIVAFICLMLTAQAFGSDMKEPIRNILDSGWLSKFLWAYVASILSIHRYLFKSYELAKDSFIYKHFGAYADTLFGIGTYGVAGTTSLALLKGLYMQTFFSGEHFIGFGTFDLISMFLLTSFLLFYCMFNTTLLLKDIIFYSENSTVEVRT
ncbi:hypothetical protein V9789_004398 [Vibrio vulnificus]|uniref:Uncharacterized protein n=1 Tax=Vibrio cholerae TaxID=666 RepID=A0A6B3LJ95_VIBCL|nr:MULTISPECIES: hypothetical protein [Gammaproteobacteria]EHK9054940.1 hypothetical protein [Vibrio vulnificus]EGQ9967360.1 hypothetical protein [Vibrio cholerae]EGR0380601.1 hypothetical protein [Vibrio cholerae]EGR2107491.1 hypothetical protein [Vibrio cholerae]EHQ2336132.1 hypothetical protein [Vibrio cholerae]